LPAAHYVVSTHELGAADADCLLHEFSDEFIGDALGKVLLLYLEAH
jgi:hypothetical protein